MSLYSVVVPVYNSEHTLGELYTRLEKVFRETLKEDFELILVDDGSKDRSYEIMTELREKDHRVRIIQMARNWTASGTSVWICTCKRRVCGNNG